MYMYTSPLVATTAVLYSKLASFDGVSLATVHLSWGLAYRDLSCVKFTVASLAAVLLCIGVTHAIEGPKLAFYESESDCIGC